MSEAYADFLRDKRVVLVTPAGYLHGQGLGAFIDSFDVVVRLNLDCPVRPDVFRALYPDKTPSITEDIGTRTDVLYHTLFNDELAEAAGQDHTPEQVTAWAADGLRWLVTRMGEHHSRNQRFFDRVGEPPFGVVHLARPFTQRLRDRLKTSPNMGTLAIAHLLAQPVASLHVLGMKWTEPWDGYRIGYGGFDAEQAAHGTGAGYWGQAPQMRGLMPHAQPPQCDYLVDAYRSDCRLTVDRVCMETAGLAEFPVVNALVLAKQHSERLPGKNIRIMAGRPLLYWVLDALQRSRRVDHVYVDTDGDDIAAIVREHFPRVEVLMNTPRANADEVIASALPRMDGEHFIQAHATSPLLSPATIDAAVASYFASLDEGNDALYGVTEHRKWFLRGDGEAVNGEPRAMARTQDLEPLYEVNSSMFIFSRTSFAAAGSRYGARPRMFGVPPLEAVDIDYEDDFQLAEALMHMRHQEGAEATPAKNARYVMGAVVYSTTKQRDGSYAVRGAVHGRRTDVVVTFDGDPTIQMAQQALLTAAGAVVAPQPESTAATESAEPTAALGVGEVDVVALAEGSVEVVKARVAGVDDVATLQLIVAYEFSDAGRHRKGVRDAVASRIRALTPAGAGV